MDTLLKNWTCERIESLAPEQRLALTSQAAGQLLQSRVLLGRCLLVLQRTHSYEEVGASSVHHYATLELGLDEREAREMLLVASRLEDLPLVTQTIEGNGISWSKLKLILRRVEVDSQELWLERARSMNVRELERAVRRDAEAQSPNEAEWTRLEVLLPAPVMCLLQQSFRNLSEQAGRRLSVADCLECLAAENLSGSPFPEAQTLEKLRDQAARDHAAAQEIDHWSAVAASEQECAGLQVVKAAPADWENPRLRFNGQSRTVSPAQRSEILRRDGYRCSVPGCPHILWLQVHHVLFYCEGGATVPENLITLCSRCHRHLHRGLLSLDALKVWRDKNGREMGTHECGFGLGLNSHDIDHADLESPVVEPAFLSSG